MFYFTTRGQAHKWATGYGMPYSFRIQRHDGLWVVVFDTREPRGC